MISLLISLVVAGLIFYVLWWLIDFIGLPAPFDKVARVVIALVAVIYLLRLIPGITSGL